MKQVYLRQLKDNTFVAKGESGHWVIMDTKKEAGGNEGGATPKELLLMALAGCTSMDVINILKKKRVPISDYECFVEGKETENHPKIFNEIHIEYRFYGGEIREEDVKQAIELSKNKYCGISAQLAYSAKITYSFNIISNKVV